MNVEASSIRVRSVQELIIANADIFSDSYHELDY